jgi:DNA helicase HerA-like ATPase
MLATLTKWEKNLAPAVAIEQTETQSIAVFWGAIIPAIPDLISLEQARTGMTYETALNQILQTQQRWIQQLHGDSRFTLSLRLITTGNSEAELVFGLVGKTEGQNEPEAISSARNFFNKVRDTFPNGYPLKPCQAEEQLALLRLPFLPEPTGSLGEFRRSITQLPSISSNEIPNRVGVQIDPWTIQQSNFQELFRALVCHTTPAAVAINLRPTKLNPEESAFIAEQARLYANIASISRTESSQNRVLSNSVQYQDKLIEAEQASQAWTKLQSSWRNSFELSVSIISQTQLPQSVVSALQTAINGTSTNQQDKNSAHSASGEIVLAQTEAQKIALRQNWADLTLHRWANTYDLGRLPWLFSPEEVHSVFRLPIADRAGVWGLPSAPGAKDARHPQKARDIATEIVIGSLYLRKKQLTQHLLISGVPGSGKTNTSLYLLETLWREHQIPWMVLEPAKTEYRGLKAVKSLQQDLLIFSLGDERVAPFRFNPFELPAGINLDSHLGALLDLFSVSMSMWGPLPNVVEQLIQEAYRRKGFTILGDNSQLTPPCFSDVASLISEIVPKLGYKKETTDEITAAISVRINKFCRGALGQMLNTTESLSFDELMRNPVILEMSQITNTDDRAFMMGLILNRCYQYWTARRHEATGELKHLLLVEEAHNLLGNASESSNQEQANPKGKAVRNFANMLAEVRGFGQGIAIAEQNPEGLIPDVMVNTNIKLAHRVVEAKNREALGRSMLLTPQQEKSLASLGVGQMLYYIGGEPEPSVTVAPNFKDDSAYGFNPRLTDAQINQFFQQFKTEHASLYAPLSGCPKDAERISCIEQGVTLVEIFSENPQYKHLKPDLILKLLAAPFGAPVLDIVRPIFGRILLERGADRLSKEQIQGILDSAISFLALEAVQEKGKVHGWLGEQVKQAHQLLIKAIFQPTPKIQPQWIEICRIGDRFLELGLPHPEYVKHPAPGVFRYENRIFLKGDRSSFTNDMKDPTISPDLALQNWARKTIVYSYLDERLKQSLIVCLAIQLTENYSEDLQCFIK